MSGSNGQMVLLASLVRDRRRACGLTQNELARRAGVSVAAVRDLEQGRTRRPQSLASLAQVLDLSLEHVRELVEIPPASGVLLQVLGPLAAWRDGAPVRLDGAARQAVLGLLALSAGALVHREAIIDVLWPDRPPAHAVNLVQAHVSRLRRLLGPGSPALPQSELLATVGASYRLQAGQAQLDLLDFGRLAAVAREAASGRNDGAACRAYRQALDLWRGEPLADVDLLRGHPAVARLARQRADMVIEYARVASGAGWHERVLGLVRDLANEEPLNEQAHAQLMIALAGCGQQAEALAIYQSICRRLDQELAMTPGPDLAAAHQRVLRQEIVPAREQPAMAAVGARDVAASPAAYVAGVARLGAPAPAVPRQLPAAADLFVGRDTELSALDALLDATTGTVVISAVGGTAGVGKTALALHWAHRVAPEFADGQLYVNLRGFDRSAEPVPPAEALGWFLAALGVAAEAMPASLEARAGLYRSVTSGRRLLIVLDNARDADQVRPLFPGSAGCAVLVTSRTRLSGLAVTDGARLLSLDVLTKAEAREMLASRLGTERAAAEADAVEELICLCARLPLALAIIAARVAGRPGQQLADLAAELRNSAQTLDVLDGGDTASSLRAVLSWSYQQLTPAAARVFRLLGLHPGPEITGPAAASLAAVPPPVARQALEELASASLLAEQGRCRFAFHDLLRSYARDVARAAESDQSCRAAVARMLDHYLHTAHTAILLLQAQRGPLDLEPPQPGVIAEHPADRQAALVWLEAEHRVLNAAIAAAAETGFDARAWQLCWATSEFLRQRGLWNEWIACGHTALDASSRIGDKAGQAWACRSLGYACARLGDYSQADAHLARSLELYRSLGDRAGEALAHGNLGWAAARQGRYAESLSHNRQALVLNQRAGNRRGEAAALNDVGWALLLLGRPREALPFCEQALEMNRELGVRTNEGASWNSLGYAEYQLGRYSKAAACYENALRIMREVGDRSNEAENLAKLGDVYRATGRRQQARDAWLQALRIFDDLEQPEADELRAKLSGEATSSTVAEASTSRRSGYWTDRSSNRGRSH